MLGRADVGGPFLVQKQSYDDLLSFVDTRSSYPSRPLLGHFFPKSGSVNALSSVWPGLGIDPLGDLYTLSLTGLGATAISRCAPTSPVADSLVGIAEIAREGVPKAVGATIYKDAARTLRSTAKKTGDEYLNLQFGWNPLMRDLQKLAKAVMNSDDYLKQLHKNSGKSVRRHYQFPQTSSVDTQSYANSVPDPPQLANPTFFTTYSGTRVETTTTTVDSWFDGDFTYYFDLKGSSSWDAVSYAAKQARLLYGLKLTPDVVWNLMPWSWLIDWGVNMGDVLTNVGLFSNDGLVMRYGYVMQHRKVSNNIQLFGIRPKSWTTDLHLQQTFATESKVRLRAFPFGFGTTFDGLSTRQMAILAALGLSKGL